MYRHDVVSSFISEMGNDMNNLFTQRWKDAEAAGEVQETEEFVKPFVKTVSKDMLKAGWTKSAVKDVVMQDASVLVEEDKKIFKLHFYSACNDNRSWALSAYLEDGAFKEKVRSLCYEEVCKMFKKQELTPKPTDIAA